MRILRWVIILVIVAFLCNLNPYSLPALFPAALPVIQVAPEFPFGDRIFSNTLIATIIVDILLLAFFYFGTRNLQMVPRGIQNTVEALIEVVYSLVQQVAGSKARRLFPLVGTIFFLVLFANWFELLPGVDSIGTLHHAEGTHQGYERLPGFPAAINPKCPVISDAEFNGMTDAEKQERAAAGCTSEPYHEEEGATAPEGQVAPETAPTEGTEAGQPGAAETDQPAAPGEGAQEEHAEDRGWIVTPFVRVASTDLNFTMALALVVVVMTQYYGVRALGAGNYFSRFFNVRGFKKSKIFGPLDFAVSILELISEVSKIISFTFRLFGNIFAGSVLIFVISWLIPYIMPVIPYLLEVFVGLIQAFVFMMLATVFITLAQVGHGDEHAEEHAH